MELTLKQALQKGIEAHKAGKAQEADRYYTAILKAQPKHPDANHNMGVLAVGVGKVEAALPFFKTALEANASIVQYWLSYVDALIKLDRMADAKAVFDQAKRNGAKGDGFDQVEKRLAHVGLIDGDQSTEAILGRAVDLRESGNYDEAIDLLLHQKKLSPNDSNILSVLSHCYILTDNLEQAKIYLDASKDINPNIASVGWNEARLLLKQKKIDEALTIAQMTNKLFPDDIEGMVVLGSCLRAVGEPKESLSFLNKAIGLNPNYAEALVNRALLSLSQKDKVNALSDLEKAHQLKPHIKQIWDLIIALYVEENRYEEAINCLVNMIKIDPSHQKSLTLLTQCNQKADDTSLAIVSFQRVLEVIEKNAPMRLNLGVAMNKQGDHESAVEQFKKALSIKPDYAEAYYNMGVALQEQRNPKEAIEAYNKALSIKPDYAEAYYNMGIALKERGKLEEAVEAFTKVLSIKPDYAEAYNNMGNALQHKGQLDEAIESYKRGLSIKPDYAEAYNNLGNALNDQGKLGGAIEAYNRALSIKPDYTEAWNNMGNALKGVIFKKPNGDLHKTIISLLDRGRYVRPSKIAIAVISLLKIEKNLQTHLELVDTEVIENPLDIISDLSQFPLLLKLMSVCPLPDLELEQLLKNLRQSILSNISSTKELSPKLLRFQSALALHCFTNEYIYNITGEEEKILQSLAASVRKDLDDNYQPSPQVILALASYKALNEYDWCYLLVVTDEIQEVFTRQVAEPNHEEKIKKQLPILDQINDNVSSEVRAQYEESPYPRWVNLGSPLQPMQISNFANVAKLKLYDNKITKVEKPDILIAGCGTGQHSIGTAARFKSSNVLAVDFSLSSLAYAKRKTKEFGIENIEYMHADILDLGQLNKKFDIIESVGVLHHMDNPIAGWEVLKDCLKPGGLIHIGLYSELARKHIVEIRNEIKELGIGSSNAERRSFRDIIIASDKHHHKQILRYPDFYSLSEVRDLLFHVQEHRFTIPKIQDCLSELGLKFCGFESQKIVSNFKQTNKRKSDPYDLDKWQSYEEANPTAFTAMYQFWCQKIV